VRVAPLCSPATAQSAAGQALAAFLAANELLHVKLDDEPRDLLWATFARQCGLEIATDGGLAFDTAIAAAQYAMAATGVFLGDYDMFAGELRDGRLVMPYATSADDGYGYYLKLHADDLADPAIAVFRSWLINRFRAQPRNPA
jgi:DNA-binding transcriptional LysR family regulator